ncbi:Peptidase S41 OS=Lysinibacillus sphaericus OX=1421 GN=LS41612_19685 PE=3 SV=1 [Lysinibacillus sphaericus]
MKKVLWLLIFILSVILFPLSNAFAANNEQQLVEEIKEIITKNYVGKVNGNLQNAKTISEIINMLDPYSTYFTKQNLKNL